MDENENIAGCSQCGAPLSPDALRGLCPRCLMALNLQTETVLTDETARAQPPLPPDQIAAHFPQLEILECLGRGGMGVVYKARQKTLNRLVALKLLAPERVRDAKFAERFTREAQALAALNHPNIVTIHDFGQTGGFYFLLMEFVDGLNLRQLLRGRKFTPEEALAIVPPLCDALQFAHDRGIVHRDIKPANLLLDKNGRVKIADFGIVKMLGGANGSSQFEGAGPAEDSKTTAAGTPGYIAPEQTTDPQKVDSRADIYSLGVVFYEMLTGELPGKPLEPPSKKVRLDVRLDEVVLRALEQEPERRYQQASQVKTAVATVANAPSPEKAKTPGTPPSQREPNRRPHQPMLKSLLLGVGVLLGIGGLVFVWARVRQHRPGPPETPLSVLAYPAAKGDVSDHINFVGSAVSSNSLVFSLTQDWVQDFVRKVSAGEKLPLTACDRDGAELGRGFVTAVDNKIDPETGTLKCTASLETERGQVMLPGMFLMVRVLGEVKHGVIRVPAEAVERTRQSAFVWVVTPENTVTRRAAVVGTVEDPWAQKMEVVQRLMAQRVGEGETNRAVIPEQWAEIHSGVAPGELVVVRPADATLQRWSQYGWKVRPALVKVVERPELSAFVVADAIAMIENLAPTGAPGQNREVQELELQQAEAQFARLKGLHDAKVISEAEFEAAQDKVELLKARLDGDSIRAAQIRLASAERELRRVSDLFATKSVSSSEFEAGKELVQTRQFELQTVQAAQRAGFVFGPVIETVVETSNWQQGYDLDTDRVVEAGTQRRHSGADLVAYQTKLGPDWLAFVGTRAEHFPDGDVRWNMAAWIVATNLAIIPTAPDAFTNSEGYSWKPAQMPKDSAHPETYLFLTLQGNMGVLQILGTNANPRGVKIRYKRVLRAQGAQASAPSFGPVTERTLGINGRECDFLVLRDGEVLHHSFIDEDLKDSTTPFMDWVRSNRVDIGFCSSTDKFYSAVGVVCFDMGTFAFPYDRVPEDRIPRFRTAEEWQAYNANHSPSATNVLIGSLVGVTNLWDDLSADLLKTPTNDVPAFFLKENKHWALWFTNLSHPMAFSTRAGVEGLLQVMDRTENPPSVKLRYKIVQPGKP